MYVEAILAYENFAQNSSVLHRKGSFRFEKRHPCYMTIISLGKLFFLTSPYVLMSLSLVFVFDVVVVGIVHLWMRTSKESI